MRTTLKRMREAKGLTLREIGEQLGFNFSYYSRIENGKKDGSYKFWEAIRNYYGLDKGFIWKVMIEDENEEI